MIQKCIKKNFNQAQLEHNQRIPLAFLAKVHYMTGKMDYLWLQMHTQHKVKDLVSFFFFFFTETWLQSNVSNSTIQLDGLPSFQADSVAEALHNLRVLDLWDISELNSETVTDTLRKCKKINRSLSQLE